MKKRTNYKWGWEYTYIHTHYLPNSYSHIYTAHIDQYHHISHQSVFSIQSYTPYAKKYSKLNPNQNKLL